MKLQEKLLEFFALEFFEVFRIREIREFFEFGNLEKFKKLPETFLELLEVS